MDTGHSLEPSMSDSMSKEKNEANLREHYNRQAGPVKWSELARFFAQGYAIEVDARVNLIDAAVSFALDESKKVSKWLDESAIVKVSDETAKEWFDTGAEVFAVIVHPWVLIKKREIPGERNHLPDN